MQNILFSEKVGAKRMEKVNMSAFFLEQGSSSVELADFHCIQLRQNFQTAAGMHTASAFGAWIFVMCNCAGTTRMQTGSLRPAARTATPILAMYSSAKANANQTSGIA